MSENRNKLMLKNTIFLYLRMFVIMCLNLVSVRLLLQALGATDYGIFNVVGGIVAMLTFLSSSMSSASQRFYACAIGAKDYTGLWKVFGVSLTTFFIIVAITVLLAETGGLWLVNNKLIIPEDRFDAVNWIYQFSIVTFSVNMLCVPFIAFVVASEKMNYYAIVSIIDAVLKLIIILVINIVSVDKLIFYGGLYMLIAFANIIAYTVYVKIRYREIRIMPCWDKFLFHQLFSYCSWYMFGAVAQVVRSQGINVLLNMFFNPIVNTARGLAYQVNAAVNMFVTSFYQAVRPQIIKRYAAHELDSMKTLVISSTKLSYYLVLIVSVPLLVLMPEILKLWLHEYPDNTILFTRLVIIVTMIETLGNPLTTAICADGKIKWYQIVTGSSILLNLPISYIALRLGCAPQSTMYIAIGIAVLTHVIRVYYAKQMFDLDTYGYCKVLVIIAIVTVLGAFVPVVFRNFVSVNSILSIVSLAILYSGWVMIIVMFIGIDKNERLYAKLITQYIRKRTAK